MKIYLAHPISGLSFEEIESYYTRTVEALDGYDVFYPLIGKRYLRNEKTLAPSGYTNPVSTDNAIVGRDNWMVQMADIVLVDLSGSTTVSIGCVMELAWAKAYEKHVITVLPQGNIHRHAFVLASSHIIFETTDEALAYLKMLQDRTI